MPLRRRATRVSRKETKLGLHALLSPTVHTHPVLSEKSRVECASSPPPRGLFAFSRGEKVVEVRDRMRGSSSPL